MELVSLLFFVMSSTLMSKCNAFDVHLPSNSIITGDVNVDADVDLSLNGAPIRQLMNNFNRVAHDIYKASAVAAQKSWNELEQGVDTVANVAENVGDGAKYAAHAVVNGIQKAENTIESDVDKLATLGKSAIHSIADLSSYIGNEVKNVEDDFKGVVSKLDDMASDIISLPEDVAKETWQKLQEAWRNVRLVGANLWQGINKYQSYLDMKARQIADTLDRESDEFKAAMRNLYDETLSKWYFVMENCEDIFKNALTLPSAAYYDMNLQEWYDTFEQLVISSSNATVDDILASARQLSDTVYNSALANFVIDSFPNLTPDQWPYVSIILQDMANVQLLAKLSLIRMQLYVNRAKTYIDHLARTDAQAAESELQMLKVEIQAKMKNLIDFTEIPFQRAYNLTSSGSLFDQIYETEGIYRDNFQRLLLYCKKYSYDMDIDDDEFASISSKLSDDRGWPSFLTASDASGSYTRDLQSDDSYEMITHKRLVADLNNAFDKLLSDLKLANDFSSKMVYYNFAEEVRAFRQAVSYLNLYVSQCIIYIETNHPKNSDAYMTALDELNAEVNKRLDVLSYRTQCALMMAVNCKRRLMNGGQNQTQMSNQNASMQNYSAQMANTSNENGSSSASTESEYNRNYQQDVNSSRMYEGSTNNYYSSQSQNEYNFSSDNQLKNMYEQNNSDLQSGLGYAPPPTQGSTDQSGIGYTPVNQSQNTNQYDYNMELQADTGQKYTSPPPPIQQDYTSGLGNEYHSSLDSVYNSNYNKAENAQWQLNNSRGSQASLEKQYSSKMQGQNENTQAGDQNSPSSQESQNNSASYDSTSGFVKENYSAQYSGYDNSGMRTFNDNSSFRNKNTNSQKLQSTYEAVPDQIDYSKNGSNDKTENSQLQNQMAGQSNYSQMNAQEFKMQTMTEVGSMDTSDSESAQSEEGDTEQGMFYSAVKEKKSDTNMMESMQTDSDNDGNAEFSMRKTKRMSKNINSSVMVKGDENPSDGTDGMTATSQGTQNNSASYDSTLGSIRGNYSASGMGTSEDNYSSFRNENANSQKLESTYESVPDQIDYSNYGSNDETGDSKLQNQMEGQSNYRQMNAHELRMQTMTDVDSMDTSDSKSARAEGDEGQDMFYSMLKTQGSDTSTVEAMQADTDNDGDAEFSMRNTKTTKNNYSIVTVKGDENPNDGIDETTIIQKKVINTETISNTMTIDSD